MSVDSREASTRGLELVPAYRLLPALLLERLSSRAASGFCSVPWVGIALLL
jgi:hypothetical protein